jgi:hypothetical protein
MSVEKWGWVSVAATGSVAVALGAFLFVYATGLDSGQNQAIAAWLQAIGSVAAIIGAFVILNQQQVAEAALRRRDEKRKYAARFMQVLLLAGDAAEAFDHLAVLLSPEEFDDPDGEPGGRSKAIARVEHVARRVDGIAAAVAGIIRAGEVELDHVNLLWKLNRNLHDLGQMLAGISDPFDELDAVAMAKFDAMVSDVKTIRFAAASISAELEREAHVKD